jgi:uncharacterized protein (TIGR03663 family)
MKWVLAVLALAAVLRLPRLADRPMHADEAMQADRLGTLLEKHSFQYDPTEYHGPALAYATLPVALLAGQRRYADLDEWTIRIAPAIAGIALVLLSFAIARLAGGNAGGVAALFTAVSPALVYYSRYYIAEVPLAACSAGLIFCTLKYGQRPELRWAVPAGVCAGLMYATKETAVLVFVAMGAGCAAARFRVRLLHLGAAVVCAAAVAALLFGSQIGESVRSLALYAERAGSGGRHAHPWYYYLQVLAVSGDGLFLLAGAVAFARMVLDRFADFAVKLRNPLPDGRGSVRSVACLPAHHRVAAFLGTYAAVLTVLYSALRYKTPWCVAGFVHGWILVAAIGASALIESEWRRPALAAVAVLAAAMAVQAIRYAIPLAADPRNPYVYAHTTRDVFDVRDRVEKVARYQPSGYGTGIDIFTRDNWWPLPWYLRRFERVRWWTDVPGKGRAGPIVLCSPETEAAVARLLYEGPPPGERELFVNLFSGPVWLRPGVEVRGYVAASAAPQ